MVGVELATVARATDALKVLPAVRITGIQPPDEPCRHYVVHVTLGSCFLEIHSARLNLTFPAQCWHPPIPPSLPQRAGPRPLPIHATPTYWPLLGTEARPAVHASPVAIRAVAAVHRLQHFCSPVSAVWTSHCVFLLPPGSCHRIPADKIPHTNRGFCERNDLLARIGAKERFRRARKVGVLGDLCSRHKIGQWPCLPEDIFNVF